MKWCPNCERSVETPMVTCPRDGTFLVMMYDQKAAQLPELGYNIGGSYKLIAGPVVGGKSAVYKGVQFHIDRTVAIKLLLPQLMHAADIVSKFQSEAMIGSRLNNRYIAPVYDFGVLPEGIPYSVSEYCQGVNLNEYAKRDGVKTQDIIAIFVKILDALAHMHERDIVFLALKPNHVLVLDPSEENKTVQPRLVDLSQAEIIGQKRLQVKDLPTVFRTYGFPAPEVLSGKKVDARSDIYSVGCLLYRALTGQAPFTGRDATELCRKHLEEKPLKLNDVRGDSELPAVLTTCVMTALEKNPEDRYASADELKRDLLMISPSIL